MRSHSEISQGLHSMRCMWLSSVGAAQIQSGVGFDEAEWHAYERIEFKNI